MNVFSAVTAAIAMILFAVDVVYGSVFKRWCHHDGYSSYDRCDFSSLHLVCIPLMTHSISVFICFSQILLVSQVPRSHGWNLLLRSQLHYFKKVFLKVFAPQWGLNPLANFCTCVLTYLLTLFTIPACMSVRPSVWPVEWNLWSAAGFLPARVHHFYLQFCFRL